MSATRPAIELSIGIIARSASPAFDRGEDVLERRARHRLPVGVVLLAHEVGVGARFTLVGDASHGHVLSVYRAALGRCAQRPRCPGGASRRRRSVARPAREPPRPARGDERDDAAAAHPGAERSGLDRRLGGDVELGAADLEVVAQRRVRRGEDRAQLGPRARTRWPRRAARTRAVSVMTCRVRAFSARPRASARHPARRRPGARGRAPRRPAGTRRARSGGGPRRRCRRPSAPARWRGCRGSDSMTMSAPPDPMPWSSRVAATAGGSDDR